MTVIDVHTHMLHKRWFELLLAHGAPRFLPGRNLEGETIVISEGAPYLTPQPEHFDYGLRIKAMDEAGVDLAIVSLTGTNCYFGGPEISLQVARIVNDSMMEAQRAHPDRIRWMASMPWEYPDLAVAELKRAHANGAIGVFVLANINGRHLTEPAFAPIWQAIDDLALPVLVHPSTPPGTREMQLNEYLLAPAVGFMIDTSLAVARLIFSGFLDRYPNLKIIASHAGAALPYIISRFDRCHWARQVARQDAKAKPSEYLRRIYFDAVTYDLDALKFCVRVGGEDKLMYGSDFPHSIGDMKGCRERVDALPARAAKAARHRNAERIFRI